jgi:hypothetical protein
MDAYVTRLYRKEEEFLEDFYETVDALLPLLPDRWQPNFRCNDLERWKRAPTSGRASRRADVRRGSHLQRPP